MNMFASVILLAWLPIIVIVYNVLPPKKAVSYLFVFSWLFLPNGGYALPGLPDYTKMSATVVGVLLCTVAFDFGRLAAIRPRWFDIPVFIWTFGAFVTALVNGLTPYDAISATTVELMDYGFPYLVGRAYMTDADALKELAEAVAIGGLCYIPFCLFEIRFSPVLSAWIYGISNWEGTRFGGFRPKVFFNNGLTLANWMMNATLISCVLWHSGALKSIRGFGFGKLVLVLVTTMVLCKSTGASCLLAFGLIIYWATMRIKKPILIWMIIAISPIYCFTRTFDIWSGMQVVDVARATVGDDRADSFLYRLNMERQLADRALERPIFGWGQFNRFQVTDATGKTVTVPDGYWIIAFGTQGGIGLVSFLCMFLLPMVVTLRRYPVATWKDQGVAPVVGLALILVITLIDCLSNALLMPILPMAMAGLLAHTPHRPIGGAEESLAAASEFAAEGWMLEAVGEFHRAIGLSSAGADDRARIIQAEAFDGLGHSLVAVGRPDEATEAFREALVLRDEIVAGAPDDDRFRDLAIARDGLSRALAESGRTAEAIEERRHALQIWEILAANHPKNVEYRDQRANTLNDLAWLLATDPDLSAHDPAQAVALAEEAIRSAPHHDALWNTLGVARYRAGDWAGTIEALERSALSSPEGLGTAFDHYFLAMAWCQLHRDDQAVEWLERGMAWAARHRPGHPTLERFREEAESLPELARHSHNT